ncbi:Hypothetical_protein [Hexamita inflata]|uniref:Hypothetical_protein n=1 Tax=Hexamita inflata TaxID=28002 RepID=A0AA86TIC3_9EUKA|nr:Hypothetical protein HINF_LOCUS5791 [Hexamita inflata]
MLNHTQQIHQSFVYQQLENVQTPAMTDYNFKQMKHLAVSVSAAGGILMVNMVIQMFMSHENEQCQWGPTIVNQILSIPMTNIQSTTIQQVIIIEFINQLNRFIHFKQQYK